MDNNKKLFVGIGNPDEQYIETRHNVGNDFIQQLAKELDIELVLKPKFGASIGQGKTGFFLAQSLSYMNDSGWPIKTIMNFYKIPPENLWVIHDDFDVQIGTVKENFDSRSAGHNGIESIIRELGTKKFNRIRVGIKPAVDVKMPLEKFVLAKFDLEELDQIEHGMKLAKEIIKTKIKES